MLIFSLIAQHYYCPTCTYVCTYVSGNAHTFAYKYTCIYIRTAVQEYTREKRDQLPIKEYRPNHMYVRTYSTHILYVQYVHTVHTICTYCTYVCTHLHKTGRENSNSVVNLPLPPSIRRLGENLNRQGRRQHVQEC